MIFKFIGWVIKMKKMMMIFMVAVMAMMFIGCDDGTGSGETEYVYDTTIVYDTIAEGIDTLYIVDTVIVYDTVTVIDTVLVEPEYVYMWTHQGYFEYYIVQYMNGDTLMTINPDPQIKVDLTGVNSIIVTSKGSVLKEWKRVIEVVNGGVIY